MTRAESLTWEGSLTRTGSLTDENSNNSTRFKNNSIKSLEKGLQFLERAKIISMAWLTTISIYKNLIGL